MTAALNVLFLTLLLGLAVLAIRARRLLTAVVVLGAYGFVIALIWANLGAVDVSFTEAVVGAGVSTVFVLAALKRTGEHEKEPGASHYQAAGGLALLALGAVLVVAKSDLPKIGSPDSPPQLHVSPYYIQKSLEETHTPNIVSAVLADYRGYDTMLETGVVFTAAMASLLILGIGERKRSAPSSDAEAPR